MNTGTTSSTHSHDLDERDEADRLRDPDPPIFTPSFPKPDEIAPLARAVGRVSILTVNRVIREIVPGCEIRIGSLSATTNSAGTAQLDISSLADGRHSLSVLPRDVSDQLVGPGFPSDLSKERIWRRFSGSVEIHGGIVVGAEPPEWAAIRNERLEVQLQPLWMLPITPAARRSSRPDLIVIHHTAGGLQGDVREFLYNPKKGVHYLIAPNGETYKFVGEDYIASHAGYSAWQGLEGVNGKSIGIEISHRTGAEYPPAQVDAVLALLKRIRLAYPDIPARRVVGHSDVGITDPRDRPPKAVGRKSSDPGSAFPWEEIEKLGCGLLISPGTVSDKIYGGYFTHSPQGKLIRGDSDNAHRYGGQIIASVSGAIAELQTDLKRIGYFCEPMDGLYGAVTSWAVQMFQEHIFSGSRRRGPDRWNSGDGRLDLDTAQMIKKVLGETLQDSGIS